MLAVVRAIWDGPLGTVPFCDAPYAKNGSPQRAQRQGSGPRYHLRARSHSHTNPHRPKVTTVSAACSAWFSRRDARRCVVHVPQFSHG